MKPDALKKLALFSILVLLSSFAGRAPAEMCSPDVVPAATLLLPYFEVDLGDDNGDGEPDGDGVNTIFSIHNALPQPALAHITFWTDWSWPSLDFDVFLTGYDVVHVDLFRALGLGSLPVTADQQADPNDTISPHHDHPEWDGTIPACAGVFPFPDPIVTGGLLDRVQNGHTGYPVPSLGGDCVGEALNGAGSCSDGACPPGTLARGYVTVDSVNRCDTVFPSDADYFEDGGQGVANNLNRLWGDFYFVNPEGLFPVATSPLVHIEADDAFNATSTASNYTFYGRYTQGEGGVDNREPLGSAWTVRYVDSVEHHTDLLVWRDATSSAVNPNDGWVCGSGPGAGPDWRPLDETQVVCFDDTEDVAGICYRSQGSRCFPLETQRQRVGDPEFPVPFAGGWCYLNLNHDDQGLEGDVDFPADPPGAIAQSWVGTLHSFSGEVVAGVRGIEIASACLALNPLISSLIFADGFESGDTSGWSNAVP